MVSLPYILSLFVPFSPHLFFAAFMLFLQAHFQAISGAMGRCFTSSERFAMPIIWAWWSHFYHVSIDYALWSCSLLQKARALLSDDFLAKKRWSLSCLSLVARLSWTLWCLDLQRFQFELLAIPNKTALSSFPICCRWPSNHCCWLLCWSWIRVTCRTISWVIDVDKWS